MKPAPPFESSLILRAKFFPAYSPPSAARYATGAIEIKSPVANVFVIKRVAVCALRPAPNAFAAPDASDPTPFVLGINGITNSASVPAPTI